MITQYNRQRLEQFIKEEQRILRKCVTLLNRRIPLVDWSDDVRMAFLFAIGMRGAGKEAAKAFSLSRHLRLKTPFLDADLPEQPTPLQRRCAERIRADLTKLVKLGAGSYLQP